MTVVDLTDRPPRSGRRSLWAGFAAWTGAALFLAASINVQSGVRMVWALMGSLFYFYVLGLLMLKVARLHRLWSEREIRSVRLVMRHIGLGLAVLVVWQGLYALYLRLAVGPSFWRLTVAGSWMFHLMTALLVYAVALGIILNRQAGERDRQRERRQSELEISMRDAELAAIRAQLEPHFLLNALNSLLALIDANPAGARAMVVRLADLLKAVFAASETVQLPLERELALIRAYFDVEKVRFGTRLQVAYAIDDRAANLLVPSLLLQPLAENAVKHGIAPCAEGGRVEVGAELTGDRLRLLVRNTMCGAANSHLPGNGRGLDLTRRRLAAAYGTDAQLLPSADRDGFTVRIELPAMRDAG